MRRERLCRRQKDLQAVYCCLDLSVEQGDDMKLHMNTRRLRAPLEAYIQLRLEPDRYKLAQTK